MSSLRGILTGYKSGSSDKLDAFICSGPSTDSKQFKIFHMEKMVLYDVNQHKNNQITEDATWA